MRFFLLTHFIVATICASALGSALAEHCYAMAVTAFVLCAANVWFLYRDLPKSRCPRCPVDHYRRPE